MIFGFLGWLTWGLLKWLASILAVLAVILSACMVFALAVGG